MNSEARKYILQDCRYAPLSAKYLSFSALSSPLVDDEPSKQQKSALRELMDCTGSISKCVILFYMNNRNRREWTKFDHMSERNSTGLSHEDKQTVAFTRKG